MIEILFSAHLRHLWILTIIAYSVLVCLCLLWIFARTCCCLPRKLRSMVGVFCCVVLFVAVGLTAYTLTESRHLQRTNLLFG
jgi:high-affinity Fe2+/Pb2+ permease